MPQPNPHATGVSERARSVHAGIYDLEIDEEESVSVVMTLEVSDLFNVQHISEPGISHLSDNVILLQYLRGESQVKRALTVLKTRASLHEPQIRQYTITSRGIELGPAFETDQDLR